MSEEHNVLTEQQKADGWQLLFDGSSTELWRGFRRDDFPAGWQVVDGTLHRAAAAGDIITREQFRDLELYLEWRVQGGGNSGVFYRVSEDEDAIWKTGPEYQILNDDVHPDAKAGPERRVGACYGLYPPSKPMARPVGEWNSTRIVVKGNHVEHWMNGEKIVGYELLSDDWQRRVEASKFVKFPLYGRIETGHVALQDHQDPVWYRNIRIRRL